MILNTALRADITFLLRIELMEYGSIGVVMEWVVIKLQREKISFDFNALLLLSTVETHCCWMGGYGTRRYEACEWSSRLRTRDFFSEGQEGCSECTSLANSCCFPAAHGHFLDNRSVASSLRRTLGCAVGRSFERRRGRGSHSTMQEIFSCRISYPIVSRHTLSKAL